MPGPRREIRCDQDRQQPADRRLRELRERIAALQGRTKERLDFVQRLDRRIQCQGANLKAIRAAQRLLSGADCIIRGSRSYEAPSED